MPLYNPAIATSNIGVSKNGTLVGTRPALNFIEGSQITISAADDAGNTEVDVTLASTAGGVSSAGSVIQGVISTYSEGSVQADSLTSIGQAFSNVGSVWFAANRAVYTPVQVQDTVTIYKMAVYVVTQAGNIDVGIYSEGGTRLVSSGSTATAVAGVQVLDIADTALTPDTYYLAFMCTSTTAVFRQSVTSLPYIESNGVKHEATGGTLPATATFAIPTTGSTVPALAAVFQGATF